MRVFIERVIYFITGALGLFCTFLLNDTDDPSIKGDSIINMVNGSIPWDGTTVTVTIICFYVTFIVLKNVLHLRGKDFSALKDFNDTDTRVLIATIILGLGISLF